MAKTSFETISALGVFTAGPFSDTSEVGTYTIAVDSITLGGTKYTPTGTTSFVLTVIDPCLSAVISGSAPAAASMSVYDALNTLSAFTDFSYTSLIGTTACGIILTYAATEAPPAGVSPLSQFLLGVNNF